MVKDNDDLAKRPKVKKKKKKSGEGSEERDALFKEIKANRKAIKKTEETVPVSFSNEDVFYPVINEDDNILVKIVKEEILKRKVILKTLSFTGPMEMNNCKRSLNLHNKMSIERFARWMELLGIDWKITYEDKEV
jgi:hypothetical protein